MGPLQVAAAVAVGAAAVSLVAGLGTYLYIRFTQDRRRGPDDAGPGGPAAPGAAPQR